MIYEGFRILCILYFYRYTMSDGKKKKVLKNDCCLYILS